MANKKATGRVDIYFVNGSRRIHYMPVARAKSLYKQINERKFTNLYLEGQEKDTIGLVINWDNVLFVDIRIEEEE